MESILTSVKKICGIPEEYDVFDMDLILHINSVFMILSQMGVGPERAYRIEDDSNEWTEFISTEDTNFESVKTYVGLKVRYIFDPPQGSVTKECLKHMIDELEWRLNFQAELS